MTKRVSRQRGTATSPPATVGRPGAHHTFLWLLCPSLFSVSVSPFSGSGFGSTPPPATLDGLWYTPPSRTGAYSRLSPAPVPLCASFVLCKSPTSELERLRRAGGSGRQCKNTPIPTRWAFLGVPFFPFRASHFSYPFYSPFCFLYLFLLQRLPALPRWGRQRDSQPASHRQRPQTLISLPSLWYTVIGHGLWYC
ncbi:hypothetical protein CALCODRAFT_198536 [Calocera cornea HHB12733]|uniref:Transmembrane protein n=1 Tax=Calocera cornea HHB12733 TaxID=1353952 RepID=A0A165HFM9_9BASI|nr:hypothetical protein CALCODRAFT_198536 [Calocera cornea HHB12733]